VLLVDADIHQIERLTCREHLHLLSQAPCFLDIQIHPERLVAAIEKARQSAEEDQLVDELIRHHAHGVMGDTSCRSTVEVSTKAGQD